MARRRIDLSEATSAPQETFITVEKMEAPQISTFGLNDFEGDVESIAPVKRLKLTIREGIDMLAAYQISDRAFIKFENESGECLFCGKKTNSPTRIICNDCDIKHIEKVYNGLKRAVAHGDDTFTVKY